MGVCERSRMTTDQENKLFRALRLIGRLLCVIVYNHLYPDNSAQDAQKELQNEASIFFRHEL